MAFIGVLPEAPGFAQQMGRGLGAGIGAGVGQASDLAKQVQLEKIKSQTASQGLLNTLSQLGSSEGGGLESLTPEQQGILAMQHPEFVQAYQGAQKLQQPEKEKKQKAQSILDTTDEMEDIIGYTGATNIPGTKSFFGMPGGWNRTAVEKRNYFNTLSASAASFFRDLETKGQLPLGLFEKVIEPRLPNADLSERENLGRIKGLRFLAKKYGGIKDIEKKSANSKNKRSLEELSNKYLND